MTPEFYRHKYLTDPDFREAEKARSRAKYQKTRRHNRSQEYYWITRYGLTPGQWDQMAYDQGYRCAICPTEFAALGPRQVHVDHNHATGKIRGLLCGSCNRALGYFKDRPDVLEKAARYLEKHQLTRDQDPNRVLM